MSHDKRSLPGLGELLARYIQRQSAQTSGFSLVDPDARVTPYESVPVPPVDARTAWAEALATLPYFDQKTNAQAFKAPANWSELVERHDPQMALAFAVGNYPQAVRNLNLLLQTNDLSTLRPQAPCNVVESSSQGSRTGNGFAGALVRLGVLRLSKQFVAADQLIIELRPTVPPSWQSALANEEAALAWHRGRADEAVAMWDSQAHSVPVLFNRGMAALFSGRPADACKHLNQAADQIPEDSGWHHLAKLYLTLAEMRAG